MRTSRAAFAAEPCRDRSSDTKLWDNALQVARGGGVGASRLVALAGKAGRARLPQISLIRGTAHGGSRALDAGPAVHPSDGRVDQSGCRNPGACRKPHSANPLASGPSA